MAFLREASPFIQMRLPIMQALVAQLDRALPSEGRGHRFESCRVRQTHSIFGCNTLISEHNCHHIMRSTYQSVIHKQASYLHLRGAVYQYIRRIPCDIRPHYKTDQLYFSLRTRSHTAANRISKSITQKLDDYWLGTRLQKIDIPKIAIINLDNSSLKNGPSLSLLR